MITINVKNTNEVKIMTLRTLVLLLIVFVLVSALTTFGSRSYSQLNVLFFCESMAASYLICRLRFWQKLRNKNELFMSLVTAFGFILQSLLMGEYFLSLYVACGVLMLLSCEANESKFLKFLAVAWTSLMITFVIAISFHGMIVV